MIPVIDSTEDVFRVVNIVLYLLTGFFMVGITYRKYPEMKRHEVIAREGISFIFLASAYASYDNLLPHPPPQIFRVTLLLPGLLMACWGFWKWWTDTPSRKSVLLARFHKRKR